MYDQELNKRKQMSEIGTIAIAGVSERDIDLLLLEEFIASPDFASWFMASLIFNLLGWETSLLSCENNLAQC